MRVDPLAQPDEHGAVDLVAAQAWRSSWLAGATGFLLGGPQQSRRPRSLHSIVERVVQGFEPVFENAYRFNHAWQTYRQIPNRIVISSWLQQKLECGGLASSKAVFGPNTDVFYPSDAPAADSRRNREDAGQDSGRRHSPASNVCNPD